MSGRHVLVLAFTWTLSLTVSLDAHHSVSAYYDQSKTVTFTGTVTKVEWANPHIFVYVDVKDDSGAMVNWAIEGGAPTSLYRGGWRKDTVKIGDVITVEASPSHTLPHRANMRVVTLNGERILGGTAPNTGAANR